MIFHTRQTLSSCAPFPVSATLCGTPKSGIRVIFHRIVINVASGHLHRSTSRACLLHVFPEGMDTVIRPPASPPPLHPCPKTTSSTTKCLMLQTLLAAPVSTGRTRREKEADSVCPAPPLPQDRSRRAVCAAAQEDTSNTTQRSPSARARASSQSSQAPQTSQHLEAPAELPQPEFRQKDSY